MSRDHGATMHRNALCLPDSRAQAYPRCVFLLSERLARWMTDCAIMSLWYRGGVTFRWMRVCRYFRLVMT